MRSKSRKPEPLGFLLHRASRSRAKTIRASRLRHKLNLGVTAEAECRCRCPRRERVRRLFT
jgi:hypothetical protein